MRSSAHPERIGIIQPGVAAGTRPTPLPWVRLIHFPTLKELNLIRFKVQLASAPALSETSAKVDQLGPDKPEACDNRSRWLSARSARYHRNRIKNHLPWRGNTSVLPLTGVDTRGGSYPVVSPVGLTTGYDCCIPSECSGHGASDFPSGLLRYGRMVCAGINRICPTDSSPPGPDSPAH